MNVKEEIRCEAGKLFNPEDFPLNRIEEVEFLLFMPNIQFPEVSQVNVKEEIRSQIIGALAGAKFPINTPEELLNDMPAGADTCCKAGDVEVTAGDAGKLLKPEDFPFSSAEQVAGTIVDRVGL